MLNVCEMAWRHRMPTESPGAKSMSALDRASMTLYEVYERFVSNFYRLRLHGWSVGPQMHMSWNAERGSPLLPILKPDIRFQHYQTGRLVVLDTKFTPNSIVTGRMGKDIFNSGHLYQIYAYLRSQEHLSGMHRNATGILLYPTVQTELDETVILQGHPIRILSVDLAQPWPDIEEGLLSLFPA
jgi:5-methylcytosine-specific restriction enzyme subunit McrC